MFRNVAPLLGRLLLSPIFIFSAVQKVMSWEDTAARMTEQGMPEDAVPYLLAGAIAFEGLGGVMALLGVWTRLGAFLLIVFLIPTTALFHDFWTLTDQAEWMNQMQHFMKNLTILGGLFLLLGFGPGGISVDGRKRKGGEA